MEIAIQHRQHVTVVSLAGSLDALTAEKVDAAFNAEVESGNTRLVAAFGDVDYTSSAGLRVLLGTLKAARRRGGDLRLAAAQAKVTRVLEISGFTSILKCYPDVDTAVASFPG